MLADRPTWRPRRCGWPSRLEALAAVASLCTIFQFFPRQQPLSAMAAVPGALQAVARRIDGGRYTERATDQWLRPVATCRSTMVIMASEDQVIGVRERRRLHSRQPPNTKPTNKTQQGRWRGHPHKGEGKGVFSVAFKKPLRSPEHMATHREASRGCGRSLSHTSSPRQRL